MKLLPWRTPRERRLPGGLARFHYPLGAAPRTAVLVPGFEESAAVRVFGGGWSQEVADYKPEALAGPASLLRWIAALLLDGRARLVSLNRAVIVFSHPEQGLLGAGDRELFWRAFQVPVFEQILGRGGEVLAAECEAHCGLHLAEGGAVPSAWDAVLETAPCPCGQATPRLIALRRAAAGGLRDPGAGTLNG